MGFYEDKTKKTIKNHFLGVLGFFLKKTSKKTKKNHPKKTGPISSLGVTTTFSKRVEMREV